MMASDKDSYKLVRQKKYLYMCIVGIGDHEIKVYRAVWHVKGGERSYVLVNCVKRKLVDFLVCLGGVLNEVIMEVNSSSH